jgi:hypothetical protein
MKFLIKFIVTTAILSIVLSGPEFYALSGERFQIGNNQPWLALSNLANNMLSGLDSADELYISSIVIHYYSSMSFYRLAQDKCYAVFYRSKDLGAIYAAFKYDLMEEIYSYLNIYFNFKQVGNKFIDTDFPRPYSKFIATEDYPEPSGKELLFKLEKNYKLWQRLKNLWIVN